MLQRTMITQIQAACHRDEHIGAALMFGSFASGEGDEFSDIEFAIFIRDEQFATFDPRRWLDAISPVAAYFQDDFGHQTALFQNGVRGEFHFMRESEVSTVAGWQGYGWFPSLTDAVLLDRSGELSRHAQILVGGPPPRGGAELVEGLALNLVNLSLFGANLLNRGEFARAWALLGRLHENLLKLVRLAENTTEHWPTPSRALEADLSGDSYERYLACTAGAQPVALCTAYRNTWTWGRELVTQLAEPLGITLPPSITARVDRLLHEALAMRADSSD